MRKGQTGADEEVIMRQTLEQGLTDSGIRLEPRQVNQLCCYGRLLLEKNQVMNLTAITEPAAVAQLHFLDCLQLTRLADFGGKRVIDVGCGAGFPGVPLLIAAKDLNLTLLDSTAKRIAWLQDEVLPELGLSANCVAARAEEYVKTCREQYDFAVSRAVARLQVLAELTLPYVKVGGSFLAMKGAAAVQEAEEAEQAIRLLGGRIEKIAEYPVADAVHRVVVIRKEKPTPAKYPRRYAQIKQSPL